MAKKQEWTATGRRKRSVARVRLVGGTGNITVNGVDVNEYMPFATLVMDLKQPLVATRPKVLPSASITYQFLSIFSFFCISVFIKLIPFTMFFV